VSFAFFRAPLHLKIFVIGVMFPADHIALKTNLYLDVSWDRNRNNEQNLLGKNKFTTKVVKATAIVF
jgi:hypothetical protein